MIIIAHDNLDPLVALAIEDYVMELFEEDCFMLWQTNPVIVVGKYQNIYNEVNIDYVESLNIPIMRRRSGGGAVYNDNNTIYYTYIVNKEVSSFSDYKTFTKPIVNALKIMGINAEFSGRNDILIDGKKFSGNSQLVNNKKITHHGTLLFDFDEEILTKALIVDEEKLKSNGVKSIKSRVTNIKSHLQKNITVNQFRDLLYKEIIKNVDNPKIYTLTEKDYIEINKISEMRYRNKDWTFGKNPKGIIEKTKRFTGGRVSSNIVVEKNIITSINFNGDFFSKLGLSDILDALVSVNYNKIDVQKALSKFEMNDYFSNITTDELLQVIF